MADLILFRPSRSATRSTSAPAPSQGAQILFFTGVRYAREVEPPPASIAQDAPPEGGMDGAGGRRRKRRG